MAKKVHIGRNGKPNCVTRWSAHVSHKPSVVVPLEKFQRLDPARQCQKCAKSVDTDGPSHTSVSEFAPREVLWTGTWQDSPVEGSPYATLAVVARSADGHFVPMVASVPCVTLTDAIDLAESMRNALAARER